MSVYLVKEIVSAPAKANTFLDKKFTLDLHRHSLGRIIDVTTTVPAPSGASTGTHRISISLIVPNTDPNAHIVFAQAEADHETGIYVYGSRPSSALFEENATFPKTEVAWMQAIRDMRVGPDTQFVLRYTNLTDADQAGGWAIYTTYALGE